MEREKIFPPEGLDIDLQNYEAAAPVFKRAAARGVIRRGERYLLIHSRYGDYKFPGGGAEPGETLEQCLVREIQEETGYRVLPQTVQSLGAVLERRKGIKGGILEMESQYFWCQVEDGAGARNLDDYEQEYGYEVAWMPLQAALALTRKCSDLERCPWVERDARVMELLIAAEEAAPARAQEGEET